MIWYLEPPRVAVGDTAPDVVFEDSVNRPVRLRNLRGTIVVVEFTALTCAPCRVLEPKLGAYATKHKDVRFLEVSIDSPGDYRKLAELLKKSPIPLLHDPYNPDRQKMGVWKFGNVATPTLFVIDRSGKFASRANIGPLDPSDWLDYRIQWAKKHS